MAQQDKREKARAHLKAAGRQTWTIKPHTRVVPNKKKPKELRKQKHKGRSYDRPFVFQGPAFAPSPG